VLAAVHGSVIFFVLFCFVLIVLLLFTLLLVFGGYLFFWDGSGCRRMVPDTSLASALGFVCGCRP
jgi:hypothetical protein